MTVEFVQTGSPVKLDQYGPKTDALVTTNQEGEKCEMTHNDGTNITIRIFFREACGVLKINIASWHEFNDLCKSGSKCTLQAANPVQQ